MEKKTQHSVELCDWYSSLNAIQATKSRRMSSAEHLVLMGDRRAAYNVSVGKCERKRKFGRPRLRWEGGIKRGFHEIEWGHGLDSCGPV